MKTAYISGHMDLTEDEFFEHYIPHIREAAENGDMFVVGDAKGTDTMAQEYLSAFTDKVVVYHMFGKPRNNKGHSPTVGGFKSDEERDAAMTKVSDYDIAWVRPGREKSGTAKNIERRAKLTK